MRKNILIICIALIAVQCGTSDKDSADQADNILLYDTGDTMQQDILPKSVQEWLAFYQKIDTQFTIGHFRSSGVNLHIADLPNAISKGNEASFKHLHFYSTDQKKYLDLYSYNYLLNKGRYVTGEIDQQVVLADLTNGSKKQLMFYGPSQSAETAGWLNDHSFILATSSKTEDEKHVKAEILLFNLKDSLYTNFQLDHTIPQDIMAKQPFSFLDAFINKPKS